MKAAPSLVRPFGASSAVLLVVSLSFFGLCVACFLAEGDISRNARPLLTLAGTVFAITLVGSIIALELQLAMLADESSLLKFFRRLSSAAFVIAVLALSGELATTLSERPDPALYRVSTASAAARAAIGLVSEGSGAQLLTVTPVSPGENNWAQPSWHVTLQTVGRDHRRVDVIVEAKSGEVYRLP